MKPYQSDELVLYRDCGKIVTASFVKYQQDPTRVSIKHGECLLTVPIAHIAHARGNVQRMNRYLNLERRKSDIEEKIANIKKEIFK